MILGYMHCYTIGPWQTIINEQVQKLKTSGLWDNTQTIHVGLLGNEPFHLTDPKFQIHDGGPNPEKYEGHTLNILQQTCTPQDHVWYTHVKGVTHIENEHTYQCVSNWRRLLEYYVIEHYQKCYQPLQEDYDIAGALWQNGLPHFSGNIWWSTGKHIHNLTKITNLEKYENGWPERHKYEFWIGSKPCRALNLHDDPLSHQSPWLYGNDVGNTYRPKIY
jgi:hypothetical protein